MKKRWLAVFGLLAIAAALALSSCGGGSSGKRLTKQQFTAKANALCAAFNKQTKAAGTPKTTAEQIAQIEKLLPADRKLVSDVSKLTPPASEQAALNHVVKLGNEQADRIETLIAAIKAKDQAKVTSLIAAGDKNNTETNTLFKQLGLSECSSS